MTSRKFLTEATLFFCGLVFDISQGGEREENFAQVHGPFPVSFWGLSVAALSLSESP
jgi:hypothetical protein